MKKGNSLLALVARGDEIHVTLLRAFYILHSTPSTP